MQNLTEYLSKAPDLILVMLGFGLIVFLHELGHFVAARWAGIRVLAFAVGFGPALFSFRKGMGVKLGSSEGAYNDWLSSQASTTPTAEGSLAGTVSPTEYRFNLLPLGGYVKMLGQEDANPNAVSDAPDSYQNCKPWKRMVVISAGVTMNLITAALLFIIVFMAGLKVEPPRVGDVQPGSPAAQAVALNAGEAGVTTPGLMPGDVLVNIDGREATQFSELVLATAMSRRDEGILLTVRRPDVPEPLLFHLKPKAGRLTGLLEAGVGPPSSPVLLEAKTKTEREDFAKSLEKFGLIGLEPGMRLVRLDNDTNIQDGNALDLALHNSDGRPVVAEFEGPAGSATAPKRVPFIITPKPTLEHATITLPSGSLVPVEHLLGLSPVMTVADAGKAAAKGLATGDIFARIGDTEYPSTAQGVAEIQAHKSGTVEMTVLRAGPDGVRHAIELPPVSVDRKGTVGFGVGDTHASDTLVSLPQAKLATLDKGEVFKPAAASVIFSPGTRVLGVGATKTENFEELRSALRAATRQEFQAGMGALVKLSIRRPVEGVQNPGVAVESVDWNLTADDVKGLHHLGWESPVALPFAPAQIIKKASSPVEAIRMGLRETRQVMLTTYITFARLAQGTVRVEHLKGPVGIAHLGTIVAGRGFTWLLCFMALISVNLAVINFMPLPIVDGGQFLFLIYEQFRGKPVPVGVQNVVTMAGLVLIGGVFLIVTYNDLAHLIGF